MQPMPQVACGTVPGVLRACRHDLAAYDIDMMIMSIVWPAIDDFPMISFSSILRTYSVDPYEMGIEDASC